MLPAHAARVQDFPGDEDFVDFLRSFAYAPDSCFAIPAFEGHFLGHTITAVDLEGAVDDAGQDLCGMELGD